MALKQLVLRYPGVCGTCGSALPPGATAVRDADTKFIWCLRCSLVVSPGAPAPSWPEQRWTSPPPDQQGLTTAPALATRVAAATPGAGSSAQHEYERRQARHRERVRRSFGIFAPLVLTLVGEPQNVSAWARGATGERLVGQLLDQFVAQEPGARVLHDRRFPGSRANLDHVVVCRGGVFVIDAKNYRGRIEVRRRWSRSPSLWVGGRRSTKLVEAAEGQAEKLQRVLAAAAPHVEVHPVLFFVDGNWSSGALRRRIGRVQLLGSSRSLRNYLSGPQVLTAEGVAAAAARLDSVLVAAA